MTPAQKRFASARDKLKASAVDPVIDLIVTAQIAVTEAEARASAAEALLEELRPVWAQGFTSDSMAAQANGDALAGMWAILGVDNQTAAMDKLRALKGNLTIWAGI